MNRITKTIIKWLPFLALIFLCMVIFSANYLPHTFLTGWDDLHSEFNFPDNLFRSLFSVWQDYEGPGTFLGVNDAADLPRLFIIWILSLFTPLSFVRYLFHFLMLFIGTVGTYVAIKTFFIKNSGKIGTIAAFFGGVFYLFNLGTVQYFAVPFEPFSVFWAMFPWLMYVVLLYTTSPTRKNLFLFALLNFAAAPMAFEHTIFYVYLLIIFLFFSGEILITKTKKSFKVFLTAFAVIIAVNAFWFLPHVYWVITSRGVQQQAVINNLSTAQTYQTAQQFGDLGSFMLLKNKPWDYVDFNDGNQQFILQAWHDHLANPYVIWIGYLFFVVILLGIITGKSRRLFVVTLFLLGFLFLANQTAVSREFNLLFRQVDIFNQVFRDPFTKFLVPTLFVFALGFSLGILFIYKRIPAKINKPFSLLGVFLLVTSLFVYNQPSFAGHLFADRMRQPIPQYYFDFFHFMNQRDHSSRIANLPQGPVWGWTTYSWGYTGSGFLWHGMSQSILNRTFDVWNSQNEEYYWEMVYALNKRDDALFNAVLQKYQIAYVMFDSAIYFPDNANSVFTILRQKEFIDSNPKLKKIKSFGTISLYETSINSNKFVSVIANAPAVATPTNWLQKDQAYLEYGDYIAGGDHAVAYPFRSLFSGRGSSDVSYQVTQSAKDFTFTTSLPAGTLIFPGNTNDEFIRFDAKNLSAAKVLPKVMNNGEAIKIATKAAVKQGMLEVILPKDNRYTSYDSLLEKKVLSPDNSVYLRELFYKSGYIVAVKSRNLSGNPLQFWVENLSDKRSDQQLYLKKQTAFGWEYFIIPPMAADGLGYSLHFDNVSIGNLKTDNDLAQLIVYPIPYNFLTGMKVVQDGAIKHSITNNQAIISLNHPWSYIYNISLAKEKISANSTLALYQTYASGWKAYVVTGWASRTFPYLFGTELKEHELVNNWANGWNISNLKNQKSNLKNNQMEIAIVFLPQWLEFVGFIILPVPFVIALFIRRKRKDVS